MTSMTGDPSCWCGNVDLEEFCPGYLRSSAFETLVSAQMPGPEIVHVSDESADLYGREYWFAHQEKDLGNLNIVTRSRSDLLERCLHWLRTILRYRRPPARVLELGCAHGGFVAVLRWAGFDATGLEISPWVVEFARKTFEVPVLLGPVEEQDLAPASLDVIALMDVLEHLRDPVASMRHCLNLLRPDGILVIQTPRHLEGTSYEDMAAGSGRRLKNLQPREHLYLFSHRSIGDFFSRLGARHLVFEPPMFEYDMFPVVSQAPLNPRPATEVASPLSATPAARMVQSMVDLGAELDVLKQRYIEAEEDRARRLELIHEQGRRLGEVEAERNNLRAEVGALHEHLQVIEADRAARLELIHERGRRLGAGEAERNNLRAEVGARHAHLQVIEADRAARLELIHEQGRRLGEGEAARKDLEAERENWLAEVEAQRRQIRTTMAQMRALQQLVLTMTKTRAYRILRKVGRWQWVDQILDKGASETAGTSYEDRASSGPPR